MEIESRRKNLKLFFFNEKKCQKLDVPKDFLRLS